MKTISYDVGWTPLQIAGEALNLAFPLRQSLKFLTQVVTEKRVEYIFPDEHTEPQLLIVVAGMTELGPTTVLIYAVTDKAEPDNPERMIMAVQVRTVSTRKGKDYDSVSLEARPKS